MPDKIDEAQHSLLMRMNTLKVVLKEKQKNGTAIAYDSDSQISNASEHSVKGGKSPKPSVNPLSAALSALKSGGSVALGGDANN